MPAVIFREGARSMSRSSGSRSSRSSSSSSRFSGRTRRILGGIRQQRIGRRTLVASNRFDGPYNDPFPAVYKARLRYSSFPQITAGAAGLAGLYKYRANSIYDPDQTGGGHQPYGRDTLATLYNHYVVDSAVITISPIGACTGKVYGVTVADDNASSLDYSVLLEQKGNTSAIGTAGGTGNQAQLMARYNRHTQWPVFVDTSAPIGASPDEEIYFTVWMADITDQVNDQVKFQVSIEYNVTFYEPKELPLS